MDETAKLLKTLTEANGVSGHEGEVRGLVRGYFKNLGDVSQDNVGSVICSLKGNNGGPRVMIAAHMDEIGFMVKHITAEGFLRFLPLGGWFNQVLMGRRVLVQTRQGPVEGVIGAKPPHLISPSDRSTAVEIEDMFIDVGASSLEDVEGIGVRVGDAVVPSARFTVLANPKTYMAKAIDDRVGLALLIQALQELQGQDHPNQVFGVATVMEEVGLRGASTAVEAVDPEVAIVIDADIAGDVPGIKDVESAVRMGRGPSVLFYDVRLLPNPKLRDLVIDSAGQLGVPVQSSLVQGYATDGGVIHLHKTGVPTVVIGIPARHIHSDGAIIHRDDYDAALRLLVAVVARLDEKTVAKLVA